MVENVSQIPINLLMRESESQKNRMIENVMIGLFSTLPDQKSNIADFTLPDGTQCFIKKFSSPYKKIDGDFVYGFDVKFNDGPFSHLEFIVKCSGWERSFI